MAAMLLLLQYSHALMDNNATPLLLAEQARVRGTSPGRMTPLACAAASKRDPLWGYVRRYPRERRQAAALAARERLIGTLVHKGRMLGKTTPRASAAPFGNPEPAAIAGSRPHAGGPRPASRRAAEPVDVDPRPRLPGHRSPGAAGRGDNFAAGIGIDLGLRSPQGPIFENLMSLVPVRAQPEELADPAALVRSLNRQMRDALATDADLGMAALIGLFARRLHHATWIAEATLRYSFSLWYAYFGAIEMPDAFFGAQVEDVYYAGPCWSPMGVTLLVNQFRGRSGSRRPTYRSRCPRSWRRHFWTRCLAIWRNEFALFPRFPNLSPSDCTPKP
jgi:hypothetical protein